MANDVLVAYASKHGATAEIAQRIGRVLGDAGVPVTVREAGDVKDVAPYSAVVLGSAVYIGKWQKEAARLLEKQEQALAECDVWLFSSGPTEEGEPVELLEGWTFPENLRPVADRIRPHDIAVFHGVLDPDTLNFFERAIVKRIDVPTGDFRDWDAIEAWAQGIALSLSEQVA